MKYIKVVFVVLMFSMTSCKEETVTTIIEENIVPVDVDLQSGFQDKSIKVFFNNQVSFQAMLSGLVPLSGPIASFSTQLERGSTSLKVRWQTNNSGLVFKIDSTSIVLGKSAKYYIGIEIKNDSVKTRVQEVPFNYF